LNVMRTTLNLDDDVAAQLQRLSRRDGRPVSRTANDLIRAGLRSIEKPGAPAPYEPPVFDSGEPLLDVTDVAEALEVLDRGG
jgi:hypothetical protein